MKLNDAFNLVKNLCDNVRVTKQERNTIDEALGTLHQAIQPPKPKVEKKEKT